MKVKPTKDGIEITPTVESMEKLMILMGGIPEASRGEQGEPMKTSDSAPEDKRVLSSPRNPGGLCSYYGHECKCLEKKKVKK